MEYQEHIQTALRYIELHLAEPLSVSACAMSCSYSEYHFLRIFKGVIGFTPMEYIRKRRLSEAAKEIYSTDKAIVDIAFAWGFESAENFIRAFQTEHGVTPGAYRKCKSSLHLFSPFIFQQGFLYLSATLPPRIEYREAFTLTGFSFETDLSQKHFDIPRFWNRYHADKLYQFISTLPARQRIDIGLLEKRSDHTCRYIIGVTSESAPLDKSCVQIHIPAQLYAVFTTPKADSFSFVESIHSTWQKIHASWLPGSPYCKGDGYEFECYCEESRTFEEEIFIPVVLK